MRGKYIGRDGSMGFRTGQTYEISTELTKIYRDKKKVDVIMVRSGNFFVHMILWKASWKIGFWRKCDGKFYERASGV